MDKNSYTYNRDKDYRRSVNIIYSILFIILALAIIGLFIDIKEFKREGLNSFSFLCVK